jgi:polysaccharide export outer membrane protein
VVAWVFWPATSTADEYVLGVEDVVAISVYLHPELERTAAIDADGNITVPPVGLIKAAGLTTKQLGDRIADRLATYLRQTTAVTVTVSQYFSRSVFVQGAVAKPGRYGFERIPTLIEVIGQAGGALPGADLSRVEVVQKKGAGGQTVYANLADALRGGNTAGLPQLLPGDIVTVPAGLGQGLAIAGEGVGVLGEVARPGIYPIGAGQDLWAVLAEAGGVTPRGDYSNIRVITRDRGTNAVVTINLKAVLDRGVLKPAIIKPGDVVFVSTNAGSRFAAAFGGFESVLRISTDVINLIVLQQLVQNDNNNNK